MESKQSKTQSMTSKRSLRAPEIFGSRSPRQRQRRTKEWACIPTLAGPRCVRPDQKTRSSLETKQWFETERDCLESNCYRQDTFHIASPDLVDLVGQYLDLESLTELSKVDPYTEQDVSDALGIAKRARELKRLLDIGHHATWEHLDKILSYRAPLDDAKRRDTETRAATLALQDDISFAGNRFRGPTTSYRFLDKNKRILKIVKRLVSPRRYSKFVWSLVGPYGENADLLAAELDMTDPQWPFGTNGTANREIVRAWLEGGNHSPEQVEAFMNYVFERSDDEPLFLNLHLYDWIGIMLLKTGSSHQSWNKYMDIVSGLLSGQMAHFLELFDPLVGAIEAMGKQKAAAAVDISREQDKLLSELIKHAVASAHEVDVVYEAIKYAGIENLIPQSVHTLSLI